MGDGQDQQPMVAGGPAVAPAEPAAPAGDGKGGGGAGGGGDGGGGDGGGGGQTTITSIALLVGPLLAALGGLALTGTIGRVQREAPLGLSIAIGLVIVAGVCWVAASTVLAPKDGGSPKAVKALQGIALVLAATGFVTALAIAVATANNEPRPEITPTLSDDGTKLSTEVTASNLPTDHRLAFRVDLLNRSQLVGHVYQAYVGPNADGDVDQTITTPLPTGGYTEIEVKAYTGTTSPACDDFSEVRESATYGSGTGCVILTMPDAAVEGNG